VLRVANLYDNELICVFTEIKKMTEKEMPEELINKPDVVKEIITTETRMKAKIEDVESNKRKKVDDAKDEFENIYNTLVKRYRKE
jgi:hypothetical protein